MAELIPSMLAYVFERFPKFSQTFCYREIAELFRQGVRPPLFSLRAPEPGPEGSWDAEVTGRVHRLPEGDAFAALADAAQRELPRDVRRRLRQARGERDSLRLHQAAYIGVRLRELGVKRVHAHFAGMAARVAYWIREFFSIPFSVTVHANDIFAPEHFAIGLDEIVSSATAIVAVSDFAADYLRDKFPKMAKRIVRVYNGIDLAAFQSSHPENPPLLLSVGRLIEKKGFDVLIEACARLEAIDFRCEIVGEGPLREGLQELIAARTLQDRVALRGPMPQKEIHNRLAAASAFALPSRVESDGSRDNLPTVIMEAMACSLPVVSTDVGGISEMVANNQTGFLVPQNDAALTADALRRLLRDAQLAAELGRRGRLLCAEKFSLQRNVSELRQVLGV